ncbi:MAG TPA: hypothetical protein VGC97_13910 [Pyrinomonadaceae bacterium]|jgi:hypothetical protein
MIKKPFEIVSVFLLFLSFAGLVSGQNPVCRASALAALKPLPKLVYKCDENLTDSDETVLNKPNRRAAISLYIKSLEKFVNADWWQTSVEDLNVCDFRKKAGALNKAQKTQYEGGEYYFRLGGNNQYRFIIAPDPCFATGYSGSNIFLLNRVRGKVFASEIIDGFYTRADFPLGFDYAVNGKETIIEISTTSGGLNPSENYYYFTIDRRTNRAVPVNLFKDKFDGKMTNRMSSDMILGEPQEYGLPRGAESLRVIKNHKLANSFYVFENTFEQDGDITQKFKRVLYKWNGKFYE